MEALVCSSLCKSMIEVKESNMLRNEENTVMANSFMKIHHDLFIYFLKLRIARKEKLGFWNRMVGSFPSSPAWSAQ
jgi:hypothetical protein